MCKTVGSSWLRSGVSTAWDARGAYPVATIVRFAYSGRICNATKSSLIRLFGGHMHSAMHSAAQACFSESPVNAATVRWSPVCRD